MSRLADILQQEYKTKGIIGGAASTLGKRTLEKLDIRNALFNGGGVGSVIGTKIFGKGYSATRRNPEKTTSPSSDELSTGSSSLLQEININSKITAKNSIALPAMAKQMNIMQKNTAKLVKIWGGTPTTKADSFFSNAKFRENQYEAQFNKKPTQVETKKEKESSSGILSMLAPLAGGLISAIGGILTTVSSIRKSLGNIPSILTGLGAAALGLGRSFSTILKFLVRSPIGRLLGLAGIVAGLDKFLEFLEGPETTDVSTDKEKVSTDVGGGYTTAEKVGYTAAGAVGAVMGVNSIKKSLTPPAKKPGFLTDFGEVGAKRAAAKTKWGRFLIWLEKKAPRLFARIGVKLAAMGGLAAVPVAGWVGALFTAGFLIWDAITIYQLWTEYSNEETESTSPTPSPKPYDISSIENNKTPSKVSETETTYDAMGAVTGTSTTPSKVSGSSGNGFDYKKLDKKQSEMASLIHRKFTEAGFTDEQATAAVINAYAESRLNPRAESPKSDKEASYGLFQMNTKGGGLGTGHSPENLMDPNYNIDLMIKAAKSDAGKSFRAATSLNAAITAFTKDLERPANAGSEAIKRIALASALTGSGTASPTAATSSVNINGQQIASSSLASVGNNRNGSLFTPEDLAALASIMGSQTMVNGGGGLKEVVSVNKSTPYEREFYNNLVNIKAL